MKCSVFLVFLVVGLGVVSCKRSVSEAGDSGQEITVSAASSLKEAFEVLGKDFEAARPGVKVVFNFAGSQSLRMQIEQGARVDVFASANSEHLAALVESGHVVSERKLAENELVLVTPAGDLGLADFADLVKAERLVLGGVEVPVGRYSEEVLAKADVGLGNGFGAAVLGRVVSRENNVRLVLAKVVLGEADAALVYRTDAVAAGERVRIVEIPPAYQVVASYSVGAVEGGVGQEFVDFVVSERGAAVLSRFGFRTDGVLIKSGAL